MELTPQDLADMVDDWLGCPPNGYLGQSYGSDVAAVLQTPMAASAADDLIEKCRQDIPLARAAGPINVYAADLDIDRKAIVFSVAGAAVIATGDRA